jgi:hypothetical protein
MTVDDDSALGCSPKRRATQAEYAPTAMSVVAVISKSPEWRPLVYTLLTILLYIALGLLAWRASKIGA